MELNTYAILIGLLVGGLVGFTGLGGGVLLLPLLILGLDVPPLTAVGTGAVYSSISKLGASVVHYRQGNVDLRLVGWMSLGSVPSALSGVWLLTVLRERFGQEINEYLTIMIGTLLMVIPILIVAETFWVAGGERPFRRMVPGWITPAAGAVWIGAIGGVLVGLTAVGAGSVIMMLLLLFFARKPATYVGTDIVHAVVLTGVAGFAHYRIGTVDLDLVMSMTLGALPGVIFGSFMTGKISGTWLRWILLVVVFGTGAAMLGRGVL